MTNLTIEPRIHDKKGITIYTVKLTERVERDRFNSIRETSKMCGGYYSRFIHRFVFPTQGDAVAFLRALGTLVDLDPAMTTDAGHAPDLDLMLGY